VERPRDTTSFKSHSNSDAGRCPLTPISVTPLVPLRLKNPADRNGPRVEAQTRWVHRLLVQRPESALVAACNVCTRQLHLPGAPSRPHHNASLRGTRFVTARNQITRGVQ
jgi:hypothetical protein